MRMRRKVCLLIKTKKKSVVGLLFFHTWTDSWFKKEIDGPDVMRSGGRP